LVDKHVSGFLRMWLCKQKGTLFTECSHLSPVTALSWTVSCRMLMQLGTDRGRCPQTMPT